MLINVDVRPIGPLRINFKLNMLISNGAHFKKKEKYADVGEKMVLQYDCSSDDVISLIENANKDERICLLRSLGIEEDITKDFSEAIFSILSKEASYSIGRLVRKGKGIPYWLVVHKTAKFLKTNSCERDEGWVQRNYQILERNIFDMVFRTFLYSIPEENRDKLEDSLSIVGNTLLRSTDKNDSKVAAVSSLGLGSTSLLAILGSSIGATIAPLWLLALSALTVKRYEASKYKKIIPFISVIASIRHRVETNGISDSDYHLEQEQIQVRSGF